MQQKNGRAHWLFGLGLAWTIVWAALGLQAFQRVSSSPHPFLRDQKINTVLLRAIIDWSVASLIEHLVFGVLLGIVALIVLIFKSNKDHAAALSIGSGFSMGWACILWSHAILLLMVPGAITTLFGINKLPMGLVILLLAAGSFILFFRNFKGGGWPSMRTACTMSLILLAFFIPHDLFRSIASKRPSLPADKPRLMIVGIDALRADVLARLAPEWEVPNKAQAVCAVPATRTAWHMLLGGDPETYSVSEVIPFRSEYTGKSPLLLIDKMKEKGIKSAFIIDDSTTLSFGLKPTNFSEVVEPDGGWKHYFSVGFGATWPVHSWIENYISPVETTNPWSNINTFFKDVDRVLTRNDFVASHCVQLHVPQYLNLEEIQTLRPWKWLLHASYSYEAYHSVAQAVADGFARQGGRANPVNHYRIRAARILAALRQSITAWQQVYPNLFGVVTSDHGEYHPPLFNGGNSNIGFLTGIHGYTLGPDTIRVPMHPFGKVRPLLLPSQVYSWFDLRDEIAAWIDFPQQFDLKAGTTSGWLVRSPTVQATHLMAPEFQVKGIEGAGLTPDSIARSTTTTIDGIWYIDDPDPVSTPKPIMSSAMVFPDKAITLNPESRVTWLRQVWKGYELVESASVSTSQAEAELAAFPGKRPLPITPVPVK